MLVITEVMMEVIRGYVIGRKRYAEYDSGYRRTVAGFTDICPKIKIIPQVRIELTTPREHTEKAKC